MTKKYIKVNEKIWKELKIRSAQEETTMGNLAEKYIREGLKKEKKNENGS
jgi:hypothetical protein